MLAQLQRRLPFFRRNDEVIQASLNVFVFLLFTSALVYVTQERRNEDIENFVDALYFTVTSLTTTRYGDILLKALPEGVVVLPGILGRVAGGSAAPDSHTTNAAHKSHSETDEREINHDQTKDFPY